MIIQVLIRTNTLERIDRYSLRSETMSPVADIDLYAPFERDVVLEIRTSKMKTMPGLKIETGIDKQLRSGRIPVSYLGLDADEHDLVFHGGPDKAIHGCESDLNPYFAGSESSAISAVF